MTDEHALTTWAQPAMSVEDAVHAYQKMAQFVKAALHDGVDYGTIPGTSKPTLYKPGAEKLNKFFGLKPHFDTISERQDWEKGFFYYHIRCNLYRADELIANADGACNSLEKKYRYRNIPEFKASEEERAKAIRKETRTAKTGKPYVMLTVENPDPYDLDNTILKMAQKRAFVAATLLAVNGSEYFTQDLEDIIDAEFVEVEKKPEPKPEPAQYSQEQIGAVLANTQAGSEDNALKFLHAGKVPAGSTVEQIASFCQLYTENAKTMKKDAAMADARKVLPPK